MGGVIRRATGGVTACANTLRSAHGNYSLSRSRRACSTLTSTGSSVTW